jgi:uncharacterized coiled-coil DUF342 family protein
MTDIAPSQPAPPLPAGVEAELDRCLVEIREMNEALRRDQAVIDRLKAETAALKAETRAINEKTHAMLSRLQAAA